MPHQHAEKVETVDAETFANWDLLAAYENAKHYYPTFTDGDEGRLKALDWAIAELKSSSRAETDQKTSSAATSPADVFCIDIGCAHGQPVAQTLAEQGFTVVGVDITPGLVDLARHNNAHLPNASFQLGDIRDWEPALDRRNGNVECVVTFYMLGHLPLSDYEEVVAKMVRWLKPNGVFVLSTVAQMHGWVTTRTATFPHTSLTIQENTALLEKNDCEVVRAWEEEWSSKGIANGDSRTNQFVCARKKWVGASHVVC